LNQDAILTKGFIKNVRLSVFSVHKCTCVS